MDQPLWAPAGEASVIADVRADGRGDSSRCPFGTVLQVESELWEVLAVVGMSVVRGVHTEAW